MLPECVYSYIWIVVRKFYNVAFSEEKENIQGEMSVSATTLNLDKMVFLQFVYIT